MFLGPKQLSLLSASSYEFKSLLLGQTPSAALCIRGVWGLVGMAIVFIAFLQVMREMGMTAALWLPHCYE